MVAVRTFETLVNFYQTTWRNIPESSRLHVRRRENLKSQPFWMLMPHYSVQFVAYELFDENA
jgi:hypothetical protein